MARVIGEISLVYYLNVYVGAAAEGHWRETHIIVSATKDGCKEAYTKHRARLYEAGITMLPWGFRQEIWARKELRTLVPQNKMAEALVALNMTGKALIECAG